MAAKKQDVWNTVTPLSRVLTAILFVALPFIGFIWGMKYQETVVGKSACPMQAR